MAQHVQHGPPCSSARFAIVTAAGWPPASKRPARCGGARCCFQSIHHGLGCWHGRPMGCTQYNRRLLMMGSLWAGSARCAGAWGAKCAAANQESLPCTGGPQLQLPRFSHMPSHSASCCPRPQSSDSAANPAARRCGGAVNQAAVGAQRHFVMHGAGESDRSSTHARPSQVARGPVRLGMMGWGIGCVMAENQSWAACRVRNRPQARGPSAHATRQKPTGAVNAASRYRR